MDLLAAQIAQLQEQARRQDATIEGQASSLSHLSSSSEAQAASIARLSSENKSLKTIVEDQDRVIGQLWRACFPSGFWVWEDAKEGREGGRWCWSNEKYGLPAPNVPRLAGPRASLESLPSELLKMVVEHLSFHDLARLGRCSFFLLELTASELSEGVLMGVEAVAKFAKARASRSTSRSDRITSLLLPKTLYLSVVDAVPFVFSSIPNNAALRPGSIDIPILALENVSCSFQLGYWTPLLRLLNPSKLRLRGSNSDATLHYPSPPSVTRVLGSTIASFTEDWDSLEAVDCRAFGSIFLLYPTDEKPSTSSFAFTEPLRKHTRGPEPVKFKLFRKTSTERTTRERVTEKELAALLEEPVEVEDEESEFWLVATRRGSK